MDESMSGWIWEWLNVWINGDVIEDGKNEYMNIL